MLKIVGLACLLILLRLFGGDFEEVTTKKESFPVDTKRESEVLVRCVNASNGIVLAWNDRDGALSYDIYRLTDNDWDYYDTIIGPEDKFIDTNVIAGVLQEYRVCGCYEDGSTVVSNKAIHIWVPPIGEVRFQNLENGVQIRWNAIYGASGYRVYRESNGQLLPIGFLNGEDATMFVDEDATEDGQTYGYAIIGVMSWEHRDFFSEYQVEHTVYEVPYQDSA